MELATFTNVNDYITHFVNRYGSLAVEKIADDHLARRFVYPLEKFEDIYEWEVTLSFVLTYLCNTNKLPLDYQINYLISLCYRLAQNYIYDAHLGLERNHMEAVMNLVKTLNYKTAFPQLHIVHMFKKEGLLACISQPSKQ